MGSFEHRDFRLFEAGRLLAIVAVQMQSVAVGWQVYAITGRPIDLGYVGLAQFLPAMLLALPAGHASDRFDRRRILLFSYVGYAICSALLAYFAIVPSSRAEGVWPIYLVLIGLGTLRAFLGPATQAILPNIVPVSDFAEAVAWNSTTRQVSSVLGPLFGGLLYYTASSPWPVYTCSCFLCLSAFALAASMRVRTGRLERELSWRSLFAGVRYVWNQKVILGAISLDLFAVLLGGATALLPPIARDILHTGPSGLGILRGAPAVGAGLTAIALARSPIGKKAGVKMFIAVGIFGVATILLGLSHNFFLSLFALIIIGASDMVSVLVRGTVVQLWTPEAMRGRVSAVNMVFIGASNELGEFESGLVAEWFGVTASVLIGGIGTLLVVVLWALLFPALRNIDRLKK